MIKLKNLSVKDFKNDVILSPGVVIRHFPDPHDRTPNDPMYFVPSESVMKFANQLAHAYGIEPVRASGAMTSTHVLLLRDYALSVGWGDVYLSGKQMVLEALFAGGHVDLSDTWTTIQDTVRLSIDLNKAETIDIFHHLAKKVPQMQDLLAVTSITGLDYAFNGLWIRESRSPIPFEKSEEGDPRNLHAKVYDSKSALSMVFSLEHGVLMVSRPADEESADAPDMHCFDVTYVTRIPTQASV